MRRTQEQLEKLADLIGTQYYTKEEVIKLCDIDTPDCLPSACRNCHRHVNECKCTRRNHK